MGLWAPEADTPATPPPIVAEAPKAKPERPRPKAERPAAEQPRDLNVVALYSVNVFGVLRQLHLHANELRALPLALFLEEVGEREAHGVVVRLGEDGPEQ